MVTVLVVVDVAAGATVVAATVVGGVVATGTVLGASVVGVVVTGAAVVGGVVAREVGGTVGAAVCGGGATEGRTTTMDGTGAAATATGMVETVRVDICWFAASRRVFNSSSCF